MLKLSGYWGKKILNMFLILLKCYTKEANSYTLSNCIKIVKDAWNVLVILGCVNY